jgi:hypothetical protein
VIAPRFGKESFYHTRLEKLLFEPDSLLQIITRGVLAERPMTVIALSLSTAELDFGATTIADITVAGGRFQFESSFLIDSSDVNSPDTSAPPGTPRFSGSSRSSESNAPPRQSATPSFRRAQRCASSTGRPSKNAEFCLDRYPRSFETIFRNCFDEHDFHRESCLIWKISLEISPRPSRLSPATEDKVPLIRERDAGPINLVRQMVNDECMPGFFLLGRQDKQTIDGVNKRCKP